MSVTTSELELLVALLREVGAGLCAKPVTELTHKGPLDLVSALDMWAEREVLEFLHCHFPDDFVLSEESSTRVEYQERIWVLDPLDGTVNRAYSVPFYAVSLALLEHGVPTLGVVYDPLHDELFLAQAGQGAFLNGERLRMDAGGAEPRARGIALTSDLVGSMAKATPEALAQLLSQHGRMRNLGSQALHLCYVAAGRLSVAASSETRLWDNAAGALIVREAGGVYSDWHNRDPFPVSVDDPALKGSSNPCVAGTSVWHARLLPLLQALLE